jgi:hypothetical protein
MAEDPHKEITKKLKEYEKTHKDPWAAYEMFPDITIYMMSVDLKRIQSTNPPWKFFESHFSAKIKKGKAAYHTLHGTYYTGHAMDDNLYADDLSGAQSAYIPAFSYSPPSYGYPMQPALGYPAGAASSSTDYAMVMAMAVGVFMMICVLCFVVSTVMAAGCFVFGQRQSSHSRQGAKYRVVDHEEV